MTVENISNRQTAQQMGTSYDYQFTFDILLKDPAAAEAMQAIKAIVKNSDGAETQLEYGTDYTVTLNSDRSGGHITVVDKRTSDDYIIIYRELSLKQETDYQDFNSMPAETLEQCFDKLTMIDQQHKEELNRCVKVNMTSSTDPKVFATEVERIYASIDNVDAVADNEANINAVAGNASNINAVAGGISSVNAVAAIKDDVVTVAGNTSNISTVAGVSSDVSVLAPIADDISKVADMDLPGFGQKTHSLKSYLDEGEILTDSEGFADVKKMAHDNFDLSKIVIVGSPTIGANGVLAGIVSGTDYVKTPSLSAPTTSIEFYWKGTFYASSNTLFGGGSAFSCGILTNNSVRIYNGGEQGSFDRTIGGNLADNDILEVYFKLTATTRLLRVTSKFGTFENTSAGTYTLPGAGAYGIGCLPAGTYPWLGSIDLKYFKIKIDGVTAFDGNVTGTDTHVINGVSVQIPYVLSKAGVKIADSTYRTQIGNLYAQQGFADYYTLDEENKTFTLPQGDLAGLRAQKENTKNKVNELTDSDTEYPSCKAVLQAIAHAGGNTAYCANSGNVDTDGEADIVATNSTETVIPYSQPILTENGTAGTSPLAVKFLYNGNENDWTNAYNNNSGYPQKPYKFFDGETSIANAQYFYLTQVNQLQMTFKDAVCLTKIEHLNISGGTVHYFTGLIKASNDGTTWTTLLNFTQTYVDASNVLTLSFADNTTSYTRYVLQYTASNWTQYGTASCPISELRLTGAVSAGTAGAQVFFKVGGTYPDLFLTNADKTGFSRASLPLTDVTGLTDGTYNVFVDKTGEEYLANTIYRQNAEPTSPSAGDVWVNTSVEPLRVYKYTGSLWDVYGKIPIGSFTVTSGAVSAVKTFPYNVNGVINPFRVVDALPANPDANIFYFVKE